LLLVGGTGGPTDFTRIGMMQALYPPGTPVYTDRKDRPGGPASSPTASYLLVCKKRTSPNEMTADVSTPER
jgi:hypothetical protein